MTIFRHLKVQDVGAEWDTVAAQHGGSDEVDPLAMEI